MSSSYVRALWPGGLLSAFQISCAHNTRTRPSSGLTSISFCGSAIEAAQHELGGAREGASFASDALQVLAGPKLPQALKAVRRVLDDLREVYAEIYATSSPAGPPPPAMATRMLAERTWSVAVVEPNVTASSPPPRAAAYLPYRPRPAGG
jgi:hypothetical protein